MGDRWAWVFLKQHHKAVLWMLLVLCLLAVLAIAIIKKAPTPIYVEQTNLTPVQFAKIQKVADELGKKQFYVADLTEVSDAMSKISWVDSTKVYRDWQRGVVVEIYPRVAIANFGSQYLLDASGVVFVPADKADLNNPNFSKLAGSHHSAKLIMQKMQKLNAWFAPLGLSVVDMVLTPRQTWLIKFNNGLRVTVDYDRVDQKLQTLSAVLQQDDSPIHLKDIDAIDLRYKNGFSVSPKKP